ncbi:MAG: PDZ domain-containing protein [Bacteroidota bacterium]
MKALFSLSFALLLFGISSLSYAQVAHTHLTLKRQLADESQVVLLDTSFFTEKWSQLPDMLEHIDVESYQQENERMIPTMESFAGEEREILPFPFMGVQIEQQHDHSQAIVITKVFEGSGAEAAGLAVGDVVFRMDEVELEGLHEFTRYISSQRVGQEVAVEFERDQQRQSLSVRLGKHPDPPRPPRVRHHHKEVYIQHAMLGVQIQRMESGGAELLRIMSEEAQAAGLQEGDVIIKVDKNPIVDMMDLIQVIRTYEPGEVVKLRFLRDNKTKRTKATLASREVKEYAYDHRGPRVNLELLLVPEEVEEVREPIVAVPPTPSGSKTLTLFPNPTSGTFELAFESAADSEIELRILNASGQSVFQETLVGRKDQPIQKQIQLGSEIARGVYFLQIEQNGQVQAEQIVLE